MTELLNIIETSIDLIIVMIPSTLLLDFPQLAILMSNPNGRYVIAGLAVVVGSIGICVVFRFIQFMFVVGAKQSSNLDVKNNVANAEKANKGLEALADDVGVRRPNPDGINFIQQGIFEAKADDGEFLAAIEQEMLSIRQLYVDGHIKKDVYVSETRRLYGKAKALKI